jgi:hypothetical protein
MAVDDSSAFATRTTAKPAKKTITSSLFWQRLQYLCRPLEHDSGRPVTKHDIYSVQLAR